MLGQTSTATPTAIPSTLENASQARSVRTVPLSAATRPTTPVASAYAPNRIVSAYRLMLGQTRMTMARTIASRPLRPSAHLIFVSCDFAFDESSDMDSISMHLPWYRLTGSTIAAACPHGIGDATDRVRDSCSRGCRLSAAGR